MFNRFREFISYPSHGRTWALLSFLILVLAIPLTVNIAQKQQEIRQQAANTCDSQDECSGWSYSSCTDEETGEPGYRPACGGFVDQCYPGSVDAQNAKLAQCANRLTESECTSEGGACVNQECGGTSKGKCSDGRNCCPVSQPSQSDLKPLCPGECTGVQTCQNADANGGIAGRIDTNYRCDSPGTACCITPATTVGHDADAICTKSISSGGLGGYCFNGACSDDNATTVGSCTRGISCCRKNVGTSTSTGGIPCGTQGGRCLSGVCVIGDSLDADPSAQQTCKTGATTPPTAGTGGGTTGTCPQITAGGNPGAGGNCSQGDPNVKIGSCTSFKCPSLPQGVAGHTISVCSFNSAANRYCYDNNPNECWPNAPCPSSLGFPISCTTGDPICASNNSKAVRLTDGSYACPNPSEGPTCPVSKSKCTVVNESKSTACKAAANTCALSGASGTRTEIRDSGSANCDPDTVANQPCTLKANDNNCTSPNICPASGSGACVTPVTGNLAGNIQLTFTLKLDGLGSTGDVKNPGSQRVNPAKKARNVSAVLKSSTGNKTASGKLNINDLSATVTTTAGNLVNGTYELFVKVDGFLQRKQGSFNLEAGKNNPIGLLPNSLPNGNVNRDTTVDASDYSKLKDCFVAKSTSGDCANADLDDDGQITLFDLNLLLREWNLNDE